MHALKLILYKEQVNEQLCLKDIILNDVLDRILENMSSVTYNLTSSFLLVSDIYFFPPKPEGAIGISKRCEY